jgi:hypothetical protein
MSIIFVDGSYRKWCIVVLSPHARHSHSFRGLNGEYHIRGPVPFADAHRAASVELVCVDKISEDVGVRLHLMATSK